MTGYKPLLGLSEKIKPKLEIPRKFFLAGFFVLTVAVIGLFSFKKIRAGKNTTVENIPQVLSETTEKQQDGTDIGDKSLGMLLLGYGGAGHEGGHLTDVLQVVYIDFETAKIALISIPRDLWVTLGNGKSTKINGAFAAYGRNGRQAMKEFIGTITGLKIDYYTGIDFVGFDRTVGINLKGIEVDVSETLDDSWYPVRGRELDTCGMTAEEVGDVSAKYSGFELERQFPCRYKHLNFEKGKVSMQGGDALAYVRSRHGSSAGDISRGIRQQEVMLALKKRILSLESLDNLPRFFSDLSKNISTDLDGEAVKYLIPAITKAKEFGVVRINLSTENVLRADSSSAGGAILVPKEGTNRWSAVQKYLKDQIEK